MFGKAAAAAAREAVAGRQQGRRGSLTRLGTAITFMRGDGLIIKIWILIWSLSGEVRRLQPVIRHKSLDWSICGDMEEREGGKGQHLSYPGNKL